MMRIFRFALPALALVATAHAQENDPLANARLVVENEGKFYQMGQDQNTRAAFLNFLADDSIVFSPGPVNGKNEWSNRPEKGISLKWKPLFCGISRGADLAYTTGPAEWRRNKEDEKPFGYGQFLSIWRKQKDGSWKVVLDVGSETPGSPKAEEELEIALSEAPAAENFDTAAATKKLREAEASFATAAKGDSTIALTEAAIPDVRVLREGVFPAVGKEPARLMLSVRRGKLTFERTGGAISDAGDLAYSYGKYNLALPHKNEKGHYLQIWRLQADGSWKLSLDYQKPLPEDLRK